MDIILDEEYCHSCLYIKYKQGEEPNKQTSFILILLNMLFVICLC